MQKPVCLITGATDGVGRATASGLAGRGFRVVLAARNADKAMAACRDIAASTGNRDIDFIVADLRSLAQVRSLAETFVRRDLRLDVLINNAGVFLPRREITGDGFEATYQVNYLAPFCLTHLLLDQLRRSSQGRIINLSSSVHAAGSIDTRNLQGEKKFSSFGAYAASKLLMLLFTVELAARLKGTPVTANAVHPGVVRTQMMLRAPGIFRAAAYLALPFALSPEQGAATSIHLASSAEVTDVSGQYFARCRPAQVRTAFNTPDHRREIWDLSLKSLRLEDALRR